MACRAEHLPHSSALACEAEDNLALVATPAADKWQAHLIGNIAENKEAEVLVPVAPIPFAHCELVVADFVNSAVYTTVQAAGHAVPLVQTEGDAEMMAVLAAQQVPNPQGIVGRSFERAVTVAALPL
jgi:hypothetical protein